MVKSIKFFSSKFSLFYFDDIIKLSSYSIDRHYIRYPCTYSIEFLPNLFNKNNSILDISYNIF